jgi:oligopeptidase B
MIFTIIRMGRRDFMRYFMRHLIEPERGIHCLVLVMFLCLPPNSLAAEQPQPPIAKVETKVDTLFGHVMIDDYHWLRDDTRSRPEVIGYLEAENAYTEAMTGHTGDLQKQLYGEMVGRIKETDQSVPVKRGEYHYYTRTEKGKQYEIYCRKHGSLDGPEEILLDVNILAQGKDFMDLGLFEVSPDNSTLAFAVDTVGNERYALRFRDLATGELYPERIDSVSTSVAWANDNRTLLYVLTDEAWRPYRVFRHYLGDTTHSDQLVFHEPDERFWIDVEKSKSHRYIFIETASETSSEYHFLDADHPGGEFMIVQARLPEVEYDVYHQGEYFYIVTNDNATNFKLMRAPVTAPSRSNWTEVIAHRPSVKLNSVTCFEDFIVLFEREGGLRQIRVWGLDEDTIQAIDFPEPTYVVYGGENPEYDSEWLRFTYESLVTPESVYDYSMRTGERLLRKQQEVAGYDAAAYASDRISVPAPDGVRVPVSLVWKKGTPMDGSSPLYLYGYGAYGISSEPYFRSNAVSLLDRGFILAIAHVRGGGEMGRQWYEDGRLLRKRNTFTDFISVADYLVDHGYTSKEGLAISGLSAGGLLIGASLNMRQDLCRVAVADVPFVDLMNTMLDETLPLTVIEYDEWGNPNEKEYFEYMLSHSPYDNVRAQRYPNMLVTASLNDTRVGYWEPAKWVARLRAVKTDDNTILLKTSMGAGHGGLSGRYRRIEETAFEFAFILNVLGID